MKKYLGILLALSFSSSLWAGATFSRAHNWVDLEVLTASDLNNEFNNILNNLDPAGVDDYSLTLSQMQTTVDPYPAAVESLATDLKGEIERLRYQILQLKKSIQTTDSTYWYQDTPGQGTFTIKTSSVGVNNTSPSYSLDVTGDARITGTTRLTGQLEASTTLISVDRSGSAATITANESTWNSLVFDREHIDRLSEFSGSVFTVSQTGYYSINAQIQFAPNLVADTGCWVVVRSLKNGSYERSMANGAMFPGVLTYPNPSMTLNFHSVLPYAAGDTIELQVSGTTACNLSVSKDVPVAFRGDGTWMTIERIP